jgi:hypothetical protein
MSDTAQEKRQEKSITTRGTKREREREKENTKKKNDTAWPELDDK